MSLEHLIEKSKEYQDPDDKSDYTGKGRLEFIDKFPLESLADLTLEQYAQGTTKDSFCYWLEFKKIMFGIGGGNASKFGIYRAQDGKYCTGFGKNKKALSEEESEAVFKSIKDYILKALEFTENDQIERIRELGAPLWNMILQKILSIYFPDKFIPVGSAEWLIACARDLEIDGEELFAENSVLINYLCKQKLDTLDEFKDWGYGKLGKFIWSTYSVETKKNYYIIGSKYGGSIKGDVFPKMIERSVVSVGSAWNIDLADYYSKNHSEITSYLEQQNEDKNSGHTLKYFLNLKPGDRIAIKSDGSPKGKKGFLSIIGIAEVCEKNGKVYEHDPEGLGQIVHVNFIKAPVRKDFEIGGYGRTIHKLSKQEHIEKIFKSEYEIVPLEALNNIPIEAQVIYAFLVESLSHRKIQEKILKTEAPARGGGFLAMNILHEFDIKAEKKGILALKPIEKEKNTAEGKYLEALNLLEKHYPKLKNTKPNDVKVDLSLNTILYGPPGTGKTYRLKNDYFKKFTDEKSTQTKEEFCEELIKDLSWGDIISIVMIDLEEAKVQDIFDHPLVQAKNRFSKNKTPKNTIWVWLQMHTKDGCPNVKYTKRNSPQFFWKDENSLWSVDKELARIETPDYFDVLDAYKNYKPRTKAEERYVFTTFHQSYSYEDFIEGIKPKLTKPEEDIETKDVSYNIEKGIFKEIAEKAQRHPEKNYAIFIDEINRGNIANIFGELITLIEEDKRIGCDNGLQAILPYSKEKFGVPKNLYIVGTMNTADRSVEALDTALRRRFSFICVQPEPEKLSEEQFVCDGIELDKMLTAINSRIEKLMDSDYCIGHSYFMTIQNRKAPLDELKSIFLNKIIPLLQEYFYGDWGKIILVLGKGFIEKKNDSVQFLATEEYEDYEEFDTKPIFNFTDPGTWTLGTFKGIYE